MTDGIDIKSLGGIAPFGYKWHRGRLVVDEKEAPVRKLIYELFITHRRKKSVAKILNNLGYRTRTGALFSDTTIGRLLRDTTAKGLWKIHKETVQIESVVDVEIWEQANRFLETSSAKQTQQLFTGLAFCSCGGKMRVPSNSAKYICPDCRRKIPTEDLEDIFRSQLKTLNDGELNSIHDLWIELSSKDKRLLVEQICDRVVVDHDTIQIEFSYYSAHFPKAVADEQQNEEANGTTDGPNSDMTVTDLDQPLLSEAAAARSLGISKMTLLRKRNAGEIGFFRVGSRILYSRERHLLPFLRSRERR